MEFYNLITYFDRLEIFHADILIHALFPLASRDIALLCVPSSYILGIRQDSFPLRDVLNSEFVLSWQKNKIAVHIGAHESLSF
jgi:hypothetical protein